MTDYSKLLIYFLIIPVAIQIIIPLLMLLGFGTMRAVRAMLGLLKGVAGVEDDVKIPKRNPAKQKLIHPWSNVA